MMNLFFNRKDGPAKRNLQAEARQFRLMQNLRALLLVLPVVLGALWLGSYFLSGDKVEIPQHEWKSQTFSGVHTQKELMDVVKASRAAFNEYIKIDRVRPQLDHATKLFQNVRSEADLSWALSELARTSGDKYVELLTVIQYNDRMARQAGKRIGVDVEFQQNWNKRNSYTISRCPADSEAYAEGLRIGDELVSIDNLHIDQMALGNPWQTVQRLKQIIDGGLLGSEVQIVVVRDDVYITATVHRSVLVSWQSLPSFSAQQVWGSSGEMPAANIVIQNLWNPDTLPRLIDTLKRFQTNGVKGLILDLQQVNGCDGDTAVRLAALFMESGVITHRISVQPDGTLMMHTWEAKDGKVQLTTKGPFAVTAEGALDKTPKDKDKVEMLDWESNVYKGTVVVTMGDETSGGGEVIAAALMPDFKRHVVTSGFLTAGKGTYTSYYQVGSEHVVAVSTAFYLRPDGTSIEVGIDGKGGRIMPNAIPNGNVRSIEEFAQRLLEERLAVIPAPDLPPEPAQDPVKPADGTSKQPAETKPAADATKK